MYMLYCTYQRVYAAGAPCTERPASHTGDRACGRLWAARGGARFATRQGATLMAGALLWRADARATAGATWRAPCAAARAAAARRRRHFRPYIGRTGNDRFTLLVSVMAAEQLYNAAGDGRVDEVRRLLDHGVQPDEYRNWVSAAPAAAGGACADALCWGAPLASRTGGRR